MDHPCPQTCKDILTHYIVQHQKVGKELKQKQRDNPHKPLHLQDIQAHQDLAELTDYCHRLYHIALELVHGRESEGAMPPGSASHAGMHTGPAPGLQSIVGKPHP